MRLRWDDLRPFEVLTLFNGNRKYSVGVGYPGFSCAELLLSVTVVRSAQHVSVLRCWRHAGSRPLA